ncbi:McrB family protein [Winogradskyella helgolandensis]|uniref:McrB family protein n=1 Tax=Winogradskyella helgolandensis TaxID=2697010 RepID=UPI0015CA1F45|nr:AAA family ATPase [Winogradskyella helgolandensis]
MITLFYFSNPKCINNKIYTFKRYMVFLSTETIKKAYQSLISHEVKNSSVLHIFLILKGCGINNMNFKPIDVISEDGYPIAVNLSMLFGMDENKPEKYEFINPFSMKEWAGQAPSEALKKWVSSRIKNNIIGGATTWRKIINEDIYSNEIKFTYNYVQEIKDLTVPNIKVKLWPLVIWYNRFMQFDRECTPQELIESFKNIFYLNDLELGLLFDSTINFNLEFASSIHDYKEIRNQIGIHPKAPDNWIESTKNITLSEPKSDYTIQSSKFIFMKASKIPSIEKINQLLKDNYQIILSGPPGTSKSYIADQIGNQLSDENGPSSVMKIQFHPQYSYQDFIGGFIVKGDKVEINRGVFLNFIDNAKKVDTPFLLIIDEINRANVSSVFGETIQCLDRNYSTKLILGGKEEEISIPKNLLIIATMNTSDRTLGVMDFALRRRFSDVYFGANEAELIYKTKLECGLSLCDFLKKINTNLKSTLKNNELIIGQSIFYNENYLNTDIYEWSNNGLEDLFNYKILPIIEDYCSNEINKIEDVIGIELSKRLTGEEFIESFRNYLA